MSVILSTVDFYKELFLVSERIENLKWNRRWKWKFVLTAKLSSMLRILAGFSPYQTCPFTEPLKVGSESYKVNQYDEEDQVTSWDRKGLSLTQSTSKDCWQSCLPSHQIWLSQFRQPGQHNPSIDLLGRAFWVFQGRPYTTVRRAAGYIPPKAWIISLSFVSKRRGKPSKDKLPGPSCLGLMLPWAHAEKFLLIPLGNCYTLRTKCFKLVMPPCTSDAPDSLLLQQLCTYHPLESSSSSFVYMALLSNFR